MFRTRPPRAVAEIIHGPLQDNPTPGFARELKDRILREVLVMGLPSMTGFLLMSVYELIDMFWLAKIGAAPVAAVTIFASFLWVLTFPNMVIGAGSVAVISRRYGEGDTRRTEQSIKNTFLLKFAFGVLLGMAGALMLPDALTALGAAPEVRDMGAKYGYLQFATLGFTLMGYSVYTAMRSIGRPRAALIVQTIGTFLNAGLDPLFIFGWGPVPALGILGASLATSVSHLAVAFTGCYLLTRPSSPIRVRWFRAPGPSWPEMRQIFRIGLPSGLNGLSFALAASVVVKIVAGFGTSIVAIYGMCNKVLHFGVMLVVGLGLGTGALIGQLLGARQLDRAWIAGVMSVRLSVGITGVFAAFLLLFAPWVVRIFFSASETSELAVPIMRVMALSLPLIGLHTGAEEAFTGAGKNTPPMILAILHSWVVVIPTMYVIGYILRFGPLGVMWGWAISHAVGAFAALWLFRRGSWLLHKV